jgi:hypothetical protein
MPVVPQPYRRLPASLCAAAILLAIVAYRSALPNPFVYDDHIVVVENPSIGRLWDVKAIVLHDVKRPLVNFSYALDHAIWGLAPFGYHVTNLLLHLLNVALLFAFARVAADDHDRTSESVLHERRGLVVAFVAASLLAVHPLMTQAVGYVAARADLLCGTFALAALLCYRTFVATGRAAWLAACLGAWLVAVGAKETAVLLPPVIALYDWLVLRAHGSAWRARLWRVHLPLFTVMGLIGLVRVGVLLGVEHGRSGSLRWTHALVEAEVLRHYLSLLVLPVKQSIFHPVAAITTISDPRGLFALAWCIALFVIVLRVGRRDRLAATGIAWFVLLLVPSAVLVMFDLGEPMAEHRVYLASMGVFVTAGCAAGSLWSLAGRGAIAWRLGLALACAALLATLTMLTIARNRVWNDPVRLWTEAVIHAPDIWVTHLMLGQELQFQGRCREAVESYQRSIALRPQEPYAYLKSGVCLTAMGRLDEATRMFDRARAMQPASPRPLVGLGMVAALVGRHDEARRWFLEAVDRDPADGAARDALAHYELQARIAACEPLSGAARDACLADNVPPHAPR